MQRTVIPPRRWVPIDLWFTATRVQRDDGLPLPGSERLVEIENRAQRAAARRRRPKRGAAK